MTPSSLLAECATGTGISTMVDDSAPTWRDRLTLPALSNQELARTRYSRRERVSAREVGLTTSTKTTSEARGAAVDSWTPRTFTRGLLCAPQALRIAARANP